MMMYPACTPANCAGDATYTTCDASSPGPDLFAPCPLTTKLETQLKFDVDGVASAPDPIGGGQDPEWLTESMTATPSATGGIVHVILGFGTGTTPEKYDLVEVVQGSQLLVNDIFCTGSDPADSDVFAARLARPLGVHRMSGMLAMALVRSRREGEIRTPDLSVPNRAL